jgi:hypothetical protein
VHFRGCFKCGPDLVQRSHSDTGAGLSGLLPGLAGFDEFGPEREQAALCGLGGMDGAATGKQEVALATAGLAEAEQMAGAIDIALFEHCGGEAEETGGAEEIGFSEIHESLDVAAAGTAGLAGEAEAGFA